MALITFLLLLIILFWLNISFGVIFLFQRSGCFLFERSTRIYRSIYLGYIVYYVKMPIFPIMMPNQLLKLILLLFNIIKGWCWELIHIAIIVVTCSLICSSVIYRSINERTSQNSRCVIICMVRLLIKYFSTASSSC